MEQLAARKAHNLEVVGSSPAPATKEFSTENNVLWNINFLLKLGSSEQIGSKGRLIVLK